MNRSNIGLFVQERVGHMIDGMNAQKVNPFEIEPSKIIKSSSIIDYELFG